MSYKIPESVLVVIHTCDLQVLLLERTPMPSSTRSLWQSVTGSKDTVDESLLMTAQREVREETGIHVGEEPNAIPPSHLRDWHTSTVFDIYPTWKHRYAPGVSQNTEHIFSLLVPITVPIVLSAKEHTQSIWLPWKEAEQKCFSPSNRAAILNLPLRAFLD